MSNPIEAIAAAYNAAKTIAVRDAGDALTAYFAEVFTTYPTLRKIVWTQYAPYYNDGEACVFSVHDPEFFFGEALPGDEEGDDSDPEDGGEGGCVWNLKGEEKQIGEAIAAVISDANDIDGLFVALYGDDAKITITRDGIEIDGADHD